MKKMEPQLKKKVKGSNAREFEEIEAVTLVN
jgi:hypothetical protein